jgi:hypothetical protein
MSRLVRSPQRAENELPIAGLEDVLGPGLGGEGAVSPGDNYLERIANTFRARCSHFSFSSMSSLSRR